MPLTTRAADSVSWRHIISRQRHDFHGEPWLISSYDIYHLSALVRFTKAHILHKYIIVSHMEKLGCRHFRFLFSKKKIFHKYALKNMKIFNIRAYPWNYNNSSLRKSTSLNNKYSKPFQTITSWTILVLTCSKPCGRNCHHQYVFSDMLLTTCLDVLIGIFREFNSRTFASSIALVSIQHICHQV